MTFVKREKAEGEYSLYSTSYGDLRVRDVFITEDTIPNYLPVTELWEAFRDATRFLVFSDSNTQQLFLVYVQELGVTDAVGFCAACSGANWDDVLTQETADGYVCDDCADDKYTECPCCSKLLSNTAMQASGHYTLADDLVCEPCIESSYSFCEPCNGYYPDDDADEHDHEEADDSGDLCCESPALTFRVRNGSGMLASDVLAEVELPTRISREGIGAIRRLLCDQDDRSFQQLAYYAMDDLAAEWQTKQGNYPKRLSQLAYKRLALKIPPEVLAQVGNIARDHSKAAGTVRVAVTRNLNMSAGDFGHSESCWWGSYFESRCALKTNGGFGLRSFDGDGCVTGRAWVMPLRHRYTARQVGNLIPTFDTENPDAFIVFNGYGELSGYAAARVMTQLSGWTYKKTDFSCEPMYVNSGGYLVAPEETMQGTRNLHLRVPQHSDLYETEAVAATLAANTEKELAHVA